jgi:hypothetical protein
MQGFSEAGTLGVVEIEEFLHRVAELRRSQHPPLTRYENAPDEYVELRHPCSHFHFGHHDDNRWSLQRALSPFAFSLLIFKHYYSSAWHAASPLRVFGRDDLPDGFLAAEKLSCRILPQDLFSAAEQALFAFS